MSLHNFLLFHLRRHVKNSGFVLHHGFEIPAFICFLEPVLKHEARVFDILHFIWLYDHLIIIQRALVEYLLNIRKLN